MATQVIHGDSGDGGRQPRGNGNGVVRFGVYEVDSRAGELRRNGIRVKLQDQPFQVLALLLEKPGEVVTREELQRRLWAADTFVDFDHSLNAAVKRLRDALGDSADNPRFVETLARRGYRFLAPVTGVNGSGASVATDSVETPAPVSTERKSVWRNWRIWLVAGGGLIVAAAGISTGWHIGHRTAQPVLPRESRLTTNSPDAPVYFATISPDGRNLAYIDPRGTFVRELATEESHALALPTGIRLQNLSWFPDGTHLLAQAVADDEEQPSLWNFSVLGGAPRRLIDGAFGAKPSPDGEQIAFLRGVKKSFNSTEIWLMDADGTQPRMITKVPGFVVGRPAWSPDGKRFAYLKDVYWPGYSEEELQIETYEVGSGRTQVVLADDALRYGLAWTKDGRIIFSRAEARPNQGESNVWSMRVSADGRPTGDPERLTSGPDWKPVINVTEDGKKMLFIRTNVVPTIYALDLEPKTKAVDGMRRLTLDEQPNRPYEWTADGKSVLYLSFRDGKSRIYRQEPGEATPEQIAGVQNSPNIMRLSPDGTEILYSTETESRERAEAVETRANDKASAASTRPSNADGAPFDAREVALFKLPVRGGTEAKLLSATGINNFQCARAPAKECVFSQYTKDALSFVEFDVKTGEKGKEILRLNEPEWQNYNWSLSPDGKWIALAKERRSAETEIRIVGTQGGAERVLKLKDWQGLTTVDWAADGKSMWASAMLRGEPRALINVDLQGRTKVVLQESKPYMGWAIPSRDGKRLAIWESAGGSNAWMLEGF